MSTSSGVGFEYTPIPVTWNSRDAILFAVSIGVKGDDLHFLYVGVIATASSNFLIKGNQEQDPNFQVFPTYPAVLCTYK